MIVRLFKGCEKPHPFMTGNQFTNYSSGALSKVFIAGGLRSDQNFCRGARVIKLENQ